jgi:hypothetical protein
MPQPEEYAPGSGFTEGELQFASFWVRNRQAVHRAIVASLIVINAACWSYALWGIVDAYAISYPVESRIMQDIAENQFVAQQLESNRPKSVIPGTVQIFEGTGGRLDIAVPIQNPNEQWYAEFTYRFIVSGEQTPQRSGFILPKQSSMLGEFGFTPKTKGSRLATLSVDHIQWRRVDPSVVGEDAQKWITDRDAFQISDMVFQPPTVVSGPSRSSFTFTNPTGFGYWSVGLYLLLLHGDSPVAATYLSLDRVKPNDRRTVNVDWFEPLSGVTDTRVVPVVNFFDRSVYLPSTEF